MPCWPWRPPPPGRPRRAPAAAAVPFPTGPSAPTPADGGTWLAASDGGVFAFGSAPFYGSMGGKRLNRPIVTMAATPTGRGYWLVASDGGVFAFGDAGFFGSTGAIALRSRSWPWLRRRRAGLLAGGVGRRRVRLRRRRLLRLDRRPEARRPIVGMAPTASGNGYWLVASDGGIFTFGDAAFRVAPAARS